MAAVERATSDAGASDPELQVAIARARDDVTAAWQLLDEGHPGLDGSLSVRVEGSDYLVTTPHPGRLRPTGPAEGTLTPERLVLCDLQGEVVPDLAALARAEVADAALHTGLRRAGGHAALVLLGGLPDLDPAELHRGLLAGDGVLTHPGGLLLSGPDAVSCARRAVALPHGRVEPPPPDLPAPAGGDRPDTHVGTGHPTPATPADPGPATSREDTQ